MDQERRQGIGTVSHQGNLHWDMDQEQNMGILVRFLKTGIYYQKVFHQMFL